MSWTARTTLPDQPDPADDPDQYVILPFYPVEEPTYSGNWSAAYYVAKPDGKVYEDYFGNRVREGLCFDQLLGYQTLQGQHATFFHEKDLEFVRDLVAALNFGRAVRLGLKKTPTPPAAGV